MSSHSIQKYGSFNSYDLLKVVAIITMIIDHIGFFFYPSVEIYRAVGRISYLLFAFCIGYNKQYSFNFILLYLAILMLMSAFIGNPESINLCNIFYESFLFAVIITRLFMNYLTSMLISNNKIILTSFILWCLSFYTMPLFQYGSPGIAIALCGYLCKEKKSTLFYRIFLFINLALFAAILIDLFNFSLECIILIIIEYLVIFKLLENFSIYKINLNQYLNKIMIFLSRRSLMIYFIHYQIFSIFHIL